MHDIPAITMPDSKEGWLLAFRDHFCRRFDTLTKDLGEQEWILRKLDDKQNRNRLRAGELKTTKEWLEPWYRWLNGDDEAMALGNLDTVRGAFRAYIQSIPGMQQHWEQSGLAPEDLFTPHDEVRNFLAPLQEAVRAMQAFDASALSPAEIKAARMDWIELNLLVEQACKALASADTAIPAALAPLPEPAHHMARAAAPSAPDYGLPPASDYCREHNEPLCRICFPAIAGHPS